MSLLTQFAERVGISSPDFTDREEMLDKVVDSVSGTPLRFHPSIPSLYDKMRFRFGTRVFLPGFRSRLTSEIESFKWLVLDHTLEDGDATQDDRHTWLKKVASLNTSRFGVFSEDLLEIAHAEISKMATRDNDDTSFGPEMKKVYRAYLAWLNQNGASKVAGLGGVLETNGTPEGDLNSSPGNLQRIAASHYLTHSIEDLMQEASPTFSLLAIVTDEKGMPRQGGANAWLPTYGRAAEKAFADITEKASILLGSPEARGLFSRKSPLPESILEKQKEILKKLFENTNQEKVLQLVDQALLVSLQYPIFLERDEVEVVAERLGLDLDQLMDKALMFPLTLAQIAMLLGQPIVQEKILARLEGFVLP